jgi:uncharacterized protein YbjT (DUF2867 family)
MAEAVAIVAGATGLVGQALVQELAADRHWREVRALVRHALPPELSGPTIVPVQVDYARLDPPPPWAAADHVFCALGAAPTSRVFYNRVKGEVEAAIAALGFRSVTIGRPSLLVGQRAEPRLAEQLGKVLGVIAPPRWKPVPAGRVARALVEAAKRDSPGLHILENRDLRVTS